MIVFVLLALKFSFSVRFLAFGVAFAGAVKLLTRFLAYKYFGFKIEFFSCFSWQTLQDFKVVLLRAWPLLLGMGVVEINILVESVIGSFLPQGEISILHYAYRIFNVPLNSISVPLTVVMLPYFSRIAISNKEKLSFYILECAKLIFWISLPTVLFLAFSSQTIFNFFFFQKISESMILKSSAVLVFLVIGLFFGCFNRLIFNVFYSLEDTKTPTFINFVATVLNGLANYLGFYFFGIYGIAAASTLSLVISTPTLIFFMKQKHDLKMLFSDFFYFSKLYFYQNFIAFLGFVLSKALFLKILENFCKDQSSYFFKSLDFSGSFFLFFILILFLFFTRRAFKVNLYFFE